VPIGLDALSTHGDCVGAATVAGGIVLSPVYHGVGGGHSDYPWTIMMLSEQGVRTHLEQTLTRLGNLRSRPAQV
jgi:creatinine amidohydrolase